MNHFVLALSLLLCACTPAPVPQPTALEGAKARWSARGFADYAFNYRVSCFCPPELASPSRVEVRGGVVSRVVKLESGEVLPAERNSAFPTVENLFARLERDLPLSPSSVFQRIDVTFDPALGFPSSVNYVEKPIVADAGSSSTLWDVKALP